MNSPDVRDPAESHGGMVRVRNMELGIQGRTAAVAAGTAGLGLGTAKALAAEGVRVVVCGRDQENSTRQL